MQYYLFETCYYPILALINMTLFLFVTIKVWRTTRSVFALTLLSFTPLYASALIYEAIDINNKWGYLICGSFVDLLPIQSWLFAMQYLKSYLYTCAGADSAVYKIHKIVKYFVIVEYATVMIYFRWNSETAYEKYIETIKQCYDLYGYKYSCYEPAFRNYISLVGNLKMSMCAQNLLNTAVTGFALCKLLQVAKRLRSSNTSLGLNRGTVFLHMFLLMLTVVSSAANLIYYIYFFRTQSFRVFYDVVYFENGVDTMLQLMIGYICGTIATDRRLNCNLVFEKRNDGTY